MSSQGKAEPDLQVASQDLWLLVVAVMGEGEEKEEEEEDGEGYFVYAGLLWTADG